MTLLERLSRNGVSREETEKILQWITNNQSHVACKGLSDGSEITIVRAHRGEVSHAHDLVEASSVAGKGKVRIGHLIEDVHMQRCMCGLKLDVTYKAQN